MRTYNKKGISIKKEKKHKGSTRKIPYMKMSSEDMRIFMERGWRINSSKMRILPQ